VSDDDFSERLGEIIAQEFHRVGLVATESLDEASFLAIKRIAMRAGYQGAVEIAAKLEAEGIHVDLEPRLLDEEGIDLLIPPS
jgi:hypothetical protein